MGGVGWGQGNRKFTWAAKESGYGEQQKDARGIQLEKHNWTRTLDVDFRTSKKGELKLGLTREQGVLRGPRPP